MIAHLHRLTRSGWLPALLSYILCSFLFTYPLIFRLTTHVPGQIAGDVPVNIWNLWWLKKALLAGASPLHSDYLFAPYGVSLAFHAFVFVKGLLAFPLQAFVPPWVAYNLVVLFTFAMAAWAMYLLARHLTGSAPAAWVAGLVYGFSPYMLTRGLGHLNYLSSEWMPLYILCLLRLQAEGGRRWAVGAGLFMLLTAYSEYYYLIYLTLFTALYLGYQLWRDSAAVLNRRFLSGLALLVGLALVGFSPILWALFGTAQSGFIYGGWSGSAKLGADLLAFVTPPPGSLLYGDLGENLFTRFSGGNATEATVFAGYAVLGLVGWGAWQLRREEAMRPWLWLTLIFFLLSLGPLLHLGGDFVFGFGPIRFAVPLPYIAIHYLPLIKGARVPARFDIMIALGLAVLCAFSLRHALRANARPWLPALGVALVIALEYLRLPYPTSAVEIPDAYRQIARDPRDVAVLEVPLGWHTGWGCTGRCGGAQQLYQTVHGKRLIGGFTSRVPESQLQALVDLPAAGPLLALQEEIPLPPSPTQRQRAAIQAQMRELLDHMPGFVVERVLRDPSVRDFLEPSSEPTGKSPPADRDKSSASADVESADVESGAELVARTHLGYIFVHSPYAENAPLMAYLQTALPIEPFYEGDGLIGFQVVPEQTR